MIKAIIADDENKVRGALKALGEWEALGIEIICESPDGDELCKNVKEFRPDIVVTDMRMPGISGKELIKELFDIDRKIKIIVVSGYDDFEYTRQAIVSKAVDYLLKPIDGESLNNALKNAMEQIKEEKAKSRAEKNGLHSKIIKLNEFVQGGNIEKAELDQYLNDTEVNSINAHYTAFLLSIFDYNNSIENAGEKIENSALFNEIIEQISDFIKSRGIAFKDLQNRNGIIIILKSNSEAILTIARDIVDSISQNFGVRTILSIGRKYTDYADIKRSYLEATSALMHSNIKQDTKIISYEEFTQDNVIIEAFSPKYEYLLTSAIENGSIKHIRKCIDGIFEELGSLTCIKIGDIAKLNNSLIQFFEKLAKKTGNEYEYMPGLVELRDKLGTRLDIITIKNEMHRFLDRISNAIEPEFFSNSNDVVYKIKKYLEDNYCFKFTLNELAEKFFLNKEYISRLFKQEFGVSVLDYMDFLRIEKAKEMLSSGNFTLSEVTENLGYYDESHFCKKFKKLTGVTPKEYRK